MNCKECRNLISNLIWDDDHLEENSDLKSHLKECHNCEIFYSEYLKGIKAIRNELRVFPDAFLYSKIQQRLNDSTQVHLKYPVNKLVWYLSAGVAALICGIYAGSTFTKDTLLKSEKELYRQEITMQSNDISGLDAGLANYFDY